MVEVHICIKMHLFMKVNGQKTEKMDLEYLLTQMHKNMKEIG